MTVDDQFALPEMGDLPVAQKTPRRRPAKQEVVTTDTGENAGDITRKWVSVCQDNTGTRVPSVITARMAKQIKILIKDHTTFEDIWKVLIVWTVRWMDNPMLSPEQLPKLLWKLQMDSTAQGRQFQTELTEATHRLLGDTNALPTPSRQQQRDTENINGRQNWRAALAAQQRQEQERGLR